MGLGLGFFRQRKNQRNLLIQHLKEDLRQLEERLYYLESNQVQVLAVLESMLEAVIAVDRQEKILFINPTTEGLFQIQQEKVKGRNLLEAVRNTPLNELILKTLKESRPQSEEIEMLTPIQRFFKVGTSPLVQQGQTIGAVAVLHDVTKLKELEQIRKEFVANVSHELKTPLTSIQASVETLMDGAIEDSQNNRRFLRCIEEDTRRLRDLIEDLLHLSRIESKEIPLKREEIALKEVIEKMTEKFQKALKEKNISLHLQIDPITLKVDLEQFQQAVGNLIDNAIKYNRPGGGIIIRAGREEEFLRLEVEDTGIGIPQEDLPRVFERFYRVDRARSRELGGTGLGLSIVKHIAERHGGRVEVTSLLGKGSCFTLWLPA